MPVLRCNLGSAHPIIVDRAGIVRYQAFEDGITVKRQVDESLVLRTMKSLMRKIVLLRVKT